jgi:hypothetical protein
VFCEESRLIRLCFKSTLNKKVFPIVREKLVSILGDLEIDELFNFVVEHVQQHASPQTIVEGLEPVGGALLRHHR